MLAHSKATAVRHWLQCGSVQTLFIVPGSPWENGYVESFNGKLRDERLDRDLVATGWEVLVLVERWRDTTTRCGPIGLWGCGHALPKPSRPSVRKEPLAWYNYGGVVTLVLSALALPSFPCGVRCELQCWSIP